ncbi:hypothetical protein NDU88_006003 [Pleurodeles waltl]|uniref:Uncharacterized protein n=1 Tax=Pleurodeles waltl TaxID=8319 RepID=A0AAV7MYB4_PLEWA|nr:hypothetical protein NDU88_006003 [Pleurodeles waltl]
MTLLACTPWGVFILNYRSFKKGKYVTARVYGEGDRPGRVLANLIRPHRDNNAITKVVDADGSELDDPALIAQRFRDYYQDLYTSRVTSTPEVVLDYLTHITLPRLEDTNREELMAPLTLTELSRALGGMAEGKALGPDGLTA